MAERPGWRPMSAVFLLVVAFCYGTGVLAVARLSWWGEALLTLGLLVSSVAFFQKDADLGARVRLIASETVFLVVAITLRALTHYGVDTGRLFDHAFALFFLVQVGGFVLQEVKSRSWFTVPMSLLMAVGLGVLYLRGAGAVASEAGVVTFWGGDAPLPLRTMYAAWILGVLLFDYAHVLPKATVLAVHVSSFVVAFFAPDFFHARVVTAYSFFILNAVILYSDRAFLSEDFAVLEPLAALRPDGSPLVRGIVGGTLIATVAGALVWLILS